MKHLICTLTILSIAPISALADIPNTFTPNTKAKAAEVNENFQALDTRITTLEEEVNDNTDSNAIESRFIAVEERLEATEEKSNGIFEAPHPLTPYTAKTADIGEVIDTIEGITYVLGALPFREYGSGVIYKVSLPMARYDCVRTESEINDYNGDRYIDNFQCANESEYYYRKGFTVQHVINDLRDDFSISGFPAYFATYWGERATISADSTEETLSSSRNRDVEPNERTSEKSITNELKLQSDLQGSYLYVLAGETRLLFQYSPSFLDNRITHEEDTPQDAGPDFTAHLSEDELNDHHDQTVMNQYKNLYNYIRIEVLQP